MLSPLQAERWHYPGAGILPPQLPEPPSLSGIRRSGQLEAAPRDARPECWGSRHRSGEGESWGDGAPSQGQGVLGETRNRPGRWGAGDRRKRTRDRGAGRPSREKEKLGDQHGERSAGGTWYRRGGGRSPGPCLTSLTHLRMGYHQALVAFAVVPPFILVHLPLVHAPVRPWSVARPRARAASPPGRSRRHRGRSACQPWLHSTPPPPLADEGRRKPRLLRLPWPSLATSGFASASPPLTTMAHGSRPS